MTDCIFCHIIAGKVPSSFVFEDDHLFVFKDIHPKAAVHLLVVPKIHIKSLADLYSEHHTLIAHMMTALPHIALLQGLKNGFRTIINTGQGGGQEVDHLHIHVMGGKDLPQFN